MTVFVCIDKNGGMSFNNRRVSRDGKVCADILEMTNGRLTVSEYSAPLFDTVTPDPDCLFCENESVLQYSPTTLVIYNFNRTYPADVYLDIDPAREGYTLKSETEFEGRSHEKITKQIWIK